jgi:hypothetical protein
VAPARYGGGFATSIPASATSPCHLDHPPPYPSVGPKLTPPDRPAPWWVTLEGVNTETQICQPYRRCVDGTASAIPGANFDTHQLVANRRALGLRLLHACCASSHLSLTGRGGRRGSRKPKAYLSPCDMWLDLKRWGCMHGCPDVRRWRRLLCRCRSPIHDLDTLDLHACTIVAATNGEQVREIGIYKIE